MWFFNHFSQNFCYLKKLTLIFSISESLNEVWQFGEFAETTPSIQYHVKHSNWIKNEIFCIKLLYHFIEKCGQQDIFPVLQLLQDLHPSYHYAD